MLKLALWVMTLLLGMAPQVDSSVYYIETGEYATRAELDELASSVMDQGLNLAIGSRESLDGHASWFGFLVGFPDLHSAQEVASSLAEQGGRGVGVYRGAHPTEEGQAAQEEQAVAPSRGVEIRFVAGGTPETSLAEIQERLVTLQRRNMRDVLSQSALFSFSRAVESPANTESGRFLFLRRGELSVLRDPSGDTRLVTLSEHAPEALFVPYIEAVTAISDPPVYGAARLLGAGLYGERSALLFSYEDETRSLLIVTSEDGRLIFKVDENSSAGEVRYVFNQWREVGGGVVVPLVIEAFWQGRLVESVQVHEITLNPQFSEEYDLYFENP